MALSVDASDLQTYLGIDGIDEPRADMLVSHAILLCESYVSPLPDAAAPVVLSAAARAYSNPTFATSEMDAGYQVVRPGGGVYLTSAERSALRRLAGGGGGAFSVSLLPSGYPESAFVEDAS